MVVGRIDRITPHFFQLIKFSCFGLHNMDDYIYIVEQYPLARVLPFDPIGNILNSLFGVEFDVLRNRFHLGVAACFAYNEKICNGFWDLAQIKRNDIFSFSCLDRGNNGFDYF